MASESRRSEACRLVIDQGLSFTEAGEVMGIGRAAVGNHLRDALESGEVVRVGYGKYAWPRSNDHKARAHLTQSKRSFGDALRMRGVCPDCGARRSKSPSEWVEINGYPQHYTEDCLRRQLEQAKERSLNEDEQIVNSRSW